MSKFVGGYYFPNWREYKYKLQDVPTEYDQLYLFHAVPTGSGFVTFKNPGGSFNADSVAAISQGRRIIISVGGAGYGFNLHTRQESDNFVSSIKNIIKEVSSGVKGKFGLDWNNFEAHILPSTSEMIYVSRTLKTFYGDDFVVTSPVAPWRSEDKDWAVEMNRAGVLDYVSPQYYDGPSLNTESYLLPNLESWVNLLGASKVGVGLGISSPVNTGFYWSDIDAANCLKKVFSRWPEIRGVFTWEIIGDIDYGNKFVKTVVPVVPKKSPKPVEDGEFIFYSQCDSWDGVTQDTKLSGLTVQQLKDHVKATPGATGFNTNGYIKTDTLKPHFEPTFTNPSQGLYQIKIPTQPPIQTFDIKNISITGLDISSLKIEATVNGKLVTGDILITNLKSS
jgi:chitinase